MSAKEGDKIRCLYMDFQKVSSFAIEELLKKYYHYKGFSHLSFRFVFLTQLFLCLKIFRFYETPGQSSRELRDPNLFTSYFTSVYLHLNLSLRIPRGPEVYTFYNLDLS